MSDDFDWAATNEDVILPEQRAIAVYTNNWGQAVIRQEKAWDDEDDTYVVIDHAEHSGHHHEAAGNRGSAG